MFNYKILATDGYSRVGVFDTAHGKIETPIFMPVGTQATVKGISKEQIKQIGSQIILSNTYHLYLRPGDEVVRDFGGLHEFMSIDLPILTDSGGFQVFSLAQVGNGSKNKESMVKITEDGVSFRSYRDGSKHFFTPERAMDIQSNLGADIIMAFDECAPGHSSYEYAKEAMNRTHRWAERCVEQHKKNQNTREQENIYTQALFPIAQGVIYDDLRVDSVKFIGNLDCPGVAIGGLSVGESKEDMIRILDTIAPHLPGEKPHYLMGLGRPEDLIEGIYRGIDMFDCVLPTRIGRHGMAYSSFGNIKITNEKFKYEKSGIPTIEGFETYVSKNYSLGYLRHLFMVEESLGGQLLSLHNLEFLLNITREAKKAIFDGKYKEFREKFWKNYR